MFFAGRKLLTHLVKNQPLAGFCPALELGSYDIINMEADPKSDIKSVTKSDIRFDIIVKPTTWIGHKVLDIQSKR